MQCKQCDGCDHGSAFLLQKLQHTVDSNRVSFHFHEGFLTSLNVLLTVSSVSNPLLCSFTGKNAHTSTHIQSLCVCLLVCVFVYRFVHTYVIHNHKLMLIFNLLFILSVAPEEKNPTKHESAFSFQFWSYNRAVLLVPTLPAKAVSFQSCRTEWISIALTSTDMKQGVQTQSGVHRSGQASGVWLVWRSPHLVSPSFFCRYSNHRFHAGVVPAHRSVCVSPCYVLLLRLSSSCLHNLHSRWLRSLFTHWNRKHWCHFALLVKIVRRAFSENELVLWLCFHSVWGILCKVC